MMDPLEGSPTMYANTDSMLETIGSLALRIAQCCPVCVESAARIAKLAGEIQSASLDRGAIRDAVEAGTADSDLSDARVNATVEAVAKMNRDLD